MTGPALRGLWPVTWQPPWPLRPWFWLPLPCVAARQLPCRLLRRLWSCWLCVLRRREPWLRPPCAAALPLICKRPQLPWPSFLFQTARWRWPGRCPPCHLPRRQQRPRPWCPSFPSGQPVRRQVLQHLQGRARQLLEPQRLQRALQQVRRLWSSLGQVLELPWWCGQAAPICRRPGAWLVQVLGPARRPWPGLPQQR